MEFAILCDSGEGLKKVTVGQGTKTSGSADFTCPISVDIDGEKFTYPTPTYVKATGTNYGSNWSYEEVASQITPIVVIGSTQQDPVKMRWKLP